MPYDPAQVALLLASHHALTGRPLLPVVPGETPHQSARRLYTAPFVALAHDTSADPLFTYTNLAAQQLFEMRWDEIVGLPSLSDPARNRLERERLIRTTRRPGGDVRRLVAVQLKSAARRRIESIHRAVGALQPDCNKPCASFAPRHPGA